MRSSLAERLIFALLLLVFLTSCGAGRKSAVSLANGGIGGTGIISYGSITAMGSITVNGVRFDTSDAAIMVAGEEQGVGDQAVQSYLGVGNVVRVEGRTSADGTSVIATRVVLSDSVQGPVESVSHVDTYTKKLVVLGQTVIIDDRTVFKKAMHANVGHNDVLEVCGLVDDRGAIRATYIDKIANDFTAGTDVKVKGTIQSLNAAAGTFEINDLKLDYSLADINDLPGKVLADGMHVAVKGKLGSVGGILTATKIELWHELGGVKDADEAEMEGFVTAIVKEEPFQVKVGSQLVQIDEGTQYEAGLGDDLEVGDWLEVEGPLVNGIIFAEEISFRD